MNIINFLNSNSNTRKIFGQRELKIIEKQLLGINLTQSEKNRLSRDIRKKLEFIKDISKYKEDFNLKKGTLIKEIIEDTIEIIKEHHYFNKIEKIILYGSTVENERTFRSDIDICVVFKDKISLREVTKFRINILGEVRDKVDVQVYNALPKKIKKEIDTKGKTLYENKR